MPSGSAQRNDPYPITPGEALRAYQRHPDHLAVMAFNDPVVVNVASVDFTRA